MLKPLKNTMSGKLEDEFNKPVESIMRCEDFKSNFARRLSNRYISRSTVSAPKQDTGLMLLSSNGDVEIAQDNVALRIEQCSQLSKDTSLDETGEAVKPPDKASSLNSDIKRTEVTVLNMEVETLRWQLAQTEGNRQMHIALLRQIVAFLNRVKDHIKQQNNEMSFQKDTLSTKLLPRSFNIADLPRSRSVVHVNKNLEYSTTAPKKISTRKICKSISNVNGFKDYNGTWNQSKFAIEPEKETSQKISEEMSRLITLANTVLSTKIPDLACSCNDMESISLKLPDLQNMSNSSIVYSHLNDTALLSEIEEDPANDLKANVCTNVNANEQNVCYNIKLSSLENAFPEVQTKDSEPNPIAIENRSDILYSSQVKVTEKRSDYNSPFIEDESGFSSMSSFQEIGIPIITVIPPSPSKEVGFLEEIPDMVDDEEKWKTDTSELDKQTMKVFWV